MNLNLVGFRWINTDGYGRFCAQTTQALRRLGHEVYPMEADQLAKPAWYLQAQGVRFDHITLQLMPPDMLHKVPGRSVILTMHESLTLPDGWADSINRHGEYLIVPSPWLVDLFEDGGVKLPIEVAKSGIDPEECPLCLPNPHRPFTFGALADRANRKGYDLVETAFYKAFDWNNQDVRLILKCRPGSLPGLHFSYSTDPRLVIWRQDVERISDIYSQFDAFMFPTRCEGWGQPPREAAACGIPTVVTRFSGTDDETDCWATPLEKYTLVESGMKGCGGKWAEPDLDELIWRMRDLYANRDVYRAKALEHAKWLRDHRTYTHAAQRLVEVLAHFFHGPIEDQLRFEAAAAVPNPDGRVLLEEGDE